MSTATTWSPQQEDIFAEFAAPAGHFAVIARAGTGKTTTIKEGIQRAPEAAKCYVAFNKRNVEEAKTKIKDPRCAVLSLNGLGHRYVLANRRGVRPDDAVEFDRIKAAIDRSDYRTLKYAPLGLLKQLVGFAKNTLPKADVTAADLLRIVNERGLYAEEAGWSELAVCKVAAAALQLALTPDAGRRISWNDQIWLPVALGWALPQFDLICVDEAQDMNPVQLELARRACRPGGRIALVGDPRQSIYGFRGAEVGGMERLVRELDAKTFPLTTTYRCPKSVVDIASRLVPDYRAADAAPEGEVDNLGSDKLVEVVQPGDAVVSRTNAPIVKACLATLRAGKRAFVQGRDVGRQLVALAEKVGKGRTTVEGFLEGVREWESKRLARVAGDDADAVSAVVEAITDQAATLAAVAEDCDSVACVFAKLNSLFDEAESQARPSVVFSTVHRAKGLEWDRVFVLVSTLRCDWSSRECQENNIGYVAVTRAKRRLTWVGGSPVEVRN